MASGTSQKLKLLYIVKILERYSDEEHPVSAAFIISKLNGWSRSKSDRLSNASLTYSELLTCCAWSMSEYSASWL